MRSITLGLMALSFLQTGYATQDANGKYILKPTTISTREASASQNMTNLAPIFPGSKGVQKRHGSSVGLVNDTSLIWGGGADDSDVMVNMTLSTGETQLILSMEHFADDLESVVCDEDLSLTFKNAELYEEAKDDWDWVNFDAQRTFLMLVNWGGCSSEAGRQPWVVTQTEYDPANFKVKFIADQLNWQDLDNPFILEWGVYSPAPSESRLANRDCTWKHPLECVEDVLTVSKDVKFSVPLDWNLPSNLFSKEVTSGLDLSVGCDDCKVSGKLSVAGRIAGSITGITESWLQINPEAAGLQLDFNPSLSVSGNLTSPWAKTWDLYTLTPPGASIQGVFSLGPKIVFRAGFEFSGIEGSATIKSGITAKISDQAMAKMDFHGDDTKFDGWSPTVDTKPVNVDAQIQGTLQIFTEVDAEFGLNILEKWDMGVGVEMRIPKVTMTLEAEFNSQGNVCPNKPEMFGLKFDASLGAQIDLAGWKSNHDDPFFKKNLLDKEIKKLATECIVFENGPKVPIDMKHSTSVAKTTTAVKTTSSKVFSSSSLIASATSKKPATGTGGSVIPTFFTSKKPATGTGGSVFQTSTKTGKPSLVPYPTGVLPLVPIYPSGWAPSSLVTSREFQPTIAPYKGYKARKVRYVN